MTSERVIAVVSLLRFSTEAKRLHGISTRLPISSLVITRNGEQNTLWKWSLVTSTRRSLPLRVLIILSSDNPNFVLLRTSWKRNTAFFWSLTPHTLVGAAH